MSTITTGIPKLAKEYLDKGKYVGLICAGMNCILPLFVSNISLFSTSNNVDNDHFCFLR